MNDGRYPAWMRRRLRGAPDQELIDALALVIAKADAGGIRSLLHPDVTLIIDSGGRGPIPATSTSGRDAVSAELSTLATAETSVGMATINSVPGFTLLRENRVIATVSAEMRSGLVSAIWVVCNPEKLRHWNRR